MSYRIRTVVEKTGIPRNTLLAWERRYGIPEPGRTEGGHRVYTEEDLRLLLRLQELLENGHRIGEAVALLRRNVEPERAVEGATPLEVLKAKLQASLLAFDRHDADDVYHRLSAFSLRRVIDDVLMPILRDVGDGWHAGEVSVAQEHFTSSFVREQLILMLNRLESGPSGGPMAICAGYPNEQHEIGLLAVAVKLALRGWRVAYLGADLPIEELADLLTRRRAELVCQSVISPRPPAELRAYTARLSRVAPPGTQIALGGPGVGELADELHGRVLFCTTFDDLLERIDRRSWSTAQAVQP